MPTTISLYNHVSHLVGEGFLDLSDADAGAFKVALVTDAYTFDAAHTVWADASGSEVASGGGYTTGGEALTGVTYAPTTGTTSKWDADDVTWSTATITARRAIIRKIGTFNSLVDPLIASVLFDDTPADVVVTGLDLQIIWAAAGILTVG